MFNNAKLHVITNNQGNQYLYSGYTGLIIEPSDRIKRFIDGENMDDSEVKDVLVGNLSETMEKSDPSSDKPVIKSLMLFITNQCNMKCTYCYERESGLHNMQTMNIETLKNTIIYILENFHHNRSMGINFFGGEPLLKISFIKNAITVLKELEKKYCTSFNFSLSTNGTLLDDELVDFLIINNIEVQVSIDGDQKHHDLHRKFVDGTGTHNIIMQNVHKLSEFMSPSARVTLFDYDIDLVKLYEQLKEVGFSSIKTECVVNPNFSNDEQGIRSFDSNLQNFANYFIDKVKEKKVTNFRDFISLLKTIHFGSKPSIFPCPTGNERLAVAADGSIYFCHRFNNVPEFKWGDINTGFQFDKRVDFLNNHHVTKRDDACNDCWAQRLCGGTCYHASYVEQGKTGVRSEFYCEFRKQLIEKSLYIYTSLSEEEKVFLNNV